MTSFEEAMERAAQEAVVELEGIRSAGILKEYRTWNKTSKEIQAKRKEDLEILKKTFTQTRLDRSGNFEREAMTTDETAMTAFKTNAEAFLNSIPATNTEGRRLAQKKTAQHLEYWQQKMREVQNVRETRRAER